MHPGFRSPETFWGMGDSAGQDLRSAWELEFTITTALQRIATQPATHLCVEAVMQFDVGFIQSSPRALAIAKFNTIFPQSIIVGGAIWEKQAKRGKVMHGNAMGQR